MLDQLWCSLACVESSSRLLEPDRAQEEQPNAAGKSVGSTVYLFGQSDARCPASPQLKQAPPKLLLL
uniref:Uncharacterized protein n=1 Tax=Oryza brachyantha TaxID=4533 RepID=J3LUD9_ORYBR